MNSDERTCWFCSVLWKQYNLCNCLTAYAKDCSKNHLTPRIFFLQMKLFYLRLIFLESVTARKSVGSEIGWELDGNASSGGHLKLTVIASSNRTQRCSTALWLHVPKNWNSMDWWISSPIPSFPKSFFLVQRQKTFSFPEEFRWSLWCIILSALHLKSHVDRLWGKANEQSQPPNWTGEPSDCVC